MIRKRSTGLNFISGPAGSMSFIFQRLIRQAALPITLLVAVLIIASCAGKQPEPYAETELDQGAMSAEAMSADVMAQPVIEEPIATNILTSQDSDGLGVELAEMSSGSKLILKTPNLDPEYKVVRLSDPSRLVVDLPGNDYRLNRVFELQDSKYVSRIRLGAHPDKSRIVLDLNDTGDLSYQAEQSSGEIVLTVTDATLMASNDEAIYSQDTALERAPEEGGLERVADVDTIDTPQEDALDDTAPVTIDVPQAALPETTPRLLSLRIDSLENEGNAVFAEMESAGFFSLKQTAPSEYVLRLEGATYEEQALSTVLAPPQSGAIRSVRPVRDGADTLLRIFATPGTALVATNKGSTIIVQPELALTRKDIRAQAADFSISTEAEDEGGLEEVSIEDDLDDLGTLLDDASKYTGRKISLDLQDTDIDNALRIIAEVSNLNIIASDDVTGKVTLRLIDVPWDQALDVILKTNGLDKVLEGNVMRIAPIEKLRQEREALKQAKEAEEELEPLVVKYIRVSYAKASELRALVETVLTERGTVTYDERTNQLIIKDIRRGVRNVAELVSRLDLRTPQVLLETQIVEAQRSFFREFGSELGFNFIQSPETGNPTGSNFPNSVDFGGSVDAANAPGIGSSFPSAVDTTAGSAISLLLDSADGAKSIDLRLSGLERDGRVRIVSRPSVVTTNNQQATIKSVEKIRVKTPAGGLSVATGSGASASGSGGIATETIEIGITLEVTPQASPDYFVLLDINAKSSSFGSQEVDGIPSEVERSATSSVLVSSGQTFAMGGIYKITDNDTVEGVPYLKDIPFLGHLFRRQGVDNADEELIFFITPRIVEGSFDDAAMKLST